MTEELLEWLWITAAIELVAHSIPSAGAPETPAATAREFLLTERAAGRIGCHHGTPIYRGLAFPLSYVWQGVDWRGVERRVVCEIFWQRADGLVEHEITVSNSVIRRGPPFVKATPPPPFKKRGEPDEDELGTAESPRKLDPDELEWILAPSQQATVVELPLVQLNRDDILRRMQECGYLPLQQELPLPASASQESASASQVVPAESPALPPNSERLAQAASSWDPLTDWSADVVSRELGIKGPVITKIVEALPTLPARAGRYRDKTVIELLEQVSANILAKALSEPRWEDSIGRLKRAWKKYNGAPKRSS